MAVKEFIDLPVTDLNKLLHELDITARDLLETVAAFSQQQFNRQPFTGSWTAGQVAEHLLKSIIDLPELLSGNTRATPERKGDENVQVIQSIFLDYDNKMQSPDFILPSEGPHDRNELLNGCRTAMDTLAEKARTMDLTVTCTDFPFPEVGELTRWEWICFAICHSKRHTLQLKNIYRHVSPAVSLNGE